MPNLLEKYEYNYAAFLPCGCLVGLCLDMANKDTAKNVSEWIKEGCHVERIHRSKVKELLEKGIGCSCEKVEDTPQPSLF